MLLVGLVRRLQYKFHCQLNCPASCAQPGCHDSARLQVDAASAAASYEQRLQEASQAVAKAKEAADQALLAAKAQADAQLHEEKERSGQLVIASMEECTRLTT